MELPEHLGGHLNKVHTDRATFLHLKSKYNIESMLDIGCATGDMVNIARLRGIDAWGIDGDWTIEFHPELKPYIIIHDFLDGPCPLPTAPFDLGWSVEFLEHVEVEFIPNYMAAFQECKYAVVTAAPPGWPGQHHVNCQDQEYWIKKFAEYDLVFQEKESLIIRGLSDMKKPFMQSTGMFYTNKKFCTDE